MLQSKFQCLHVCTYLRNYNNHNSKTKQSKHTNKQAKIKTKTKHSLPAYRIKKSELAWLVINCWLSTLLSTCWLSWFWFFCLVGFFSTWHKLFSSGKRDSQLRKIHLSDWSIDKHVGTFSWLMIGVENTSSVCIMLSLGKWFWAVWES